MPPIPKFDLSSGERLEQEENRERIEEVQEPPTIVGP